MSQQQNPIQPDATSIDPKIELIAMRMASSRAPGLVEAQAARYKELIRQAAASGTDPMMVDLRPAHIPTAPGALALADAYVGDGDVIKDSGFYGERVTRPLTDAEAGRIQTILTLRNGEQVHVDARQVQLRALRNPSFTRGSDGVPVQADLPASAVLIGSDWGFRIGDNFPGITVRELGGGVAVLWMSIGGVPHIGLQSHKRGLMASPKNQAAASLECPRGFADPGETDYEATALRELQEEQPNLDVTALLERSAGLDRHVVKGLNSNTAVFNYPADEQGNMRGVNFVFREIPSTGFELNAEGVYVLPQGALPSVIMNKAERGKIGQIRFYPCHKAAQLVTCLMTRFAISEVTLRALAKISQSEALLGALNTLSAHR